jgi:serine/threonine protein kinase
LPQTNINRLRVTDFGLATMLEDEIGKVSEEDGSEDVRRTHLTHGIVGTPLYMSPEQWKGEAVGTFTDMYAFGCILFEMAVGQYAVVGRTIYQLREAHNKGILQPFPLSLSTDVCDALLKSLSVNYRNRYENWADVIVALELICAKQAIKSEIGIRVSTERNHDDDVQYGWSHNTIGISYLDIGKLQASLKYFERALETGRNVGDQELMVAASGNLGITFKNLGGARQAIRYYEQCLKIHESVNDQHGLGADLENLGNAYKDLGDTKKAIECFERALSILGGYGNLQEEGKIS